MITIKNVSTLDGQQADYTIPSSQDQTINGTGLHLLPNVIDPHIRFGSIDSENWNLAVHSVIRGGITTLFDIPSNDTAAYSKDYLELKRKGIDKRLFKLQAPLQFLFYGNPIPTKTTEIGIAKKLIKAIILPIDSADEMDASWEKVFKIAAWEDLPVVINASHSDLSLLEKAILFTEKYSLRLFVLNVSSEKEIRIIQAGRKKELLIYAETTPQHLFQDNASEADILWNALNNGVIETIGSGYDVEHPSKERAIHHGSNLSLADPVFMLPRLLTGAKERKIPIEKLLRHTRFNIQDIYLMEKDLDVVLVDLNKEQTIQKVANGRTENIKLIGWPAYTIIQGQAFAIPATGYQVHPML